MTSSCQGTRDDAVCGANKQCSTTAERAGRQRVHQRHHGQRRVASTTTSSAPARPPRRVPPVPARAPTARSATQGRSAAGTCQPLRTQGQTCAAASDCAGGLACTDGVCCNSTCGHSARRATSPAASAPAPTSRWAKDPAIGVRRGVVHGLVPGLGRHQRRPVLHRLRTRRRTRWTATARAPARRRCTGVPVSVRQHGGARLRQRLSGEEPLHVHWDGGASVQLGDAVAREPDLQQRCLSAERAALHRAACRSRARTR
jgi:hypothetical protein